MLLWCWWCCTVDGIQWWCCVRMCVWWWLWCWSFLSISPILWYFVAIEPSESWWLWWRWYSYRSGVNGPRFSILLHYFVTALKVAWGKHSIIMETVMMVMIVEVVILPWLGVVMVVIWWRLWWWLRAWLELHVAAFIFSCFHLIFLLFSIILFISVKLLLILLSWLKYLHLVAFMFLLT